MEIIKKKYEEIKQKHQGCVVLFRVGDYYECYYDDADTVSSALSIELQQDGERKMTAFPFHALDNYLPLLIRHGIRVAIVEESKIQPENTGEELKDTKSLAVKNINLSLIEPSPLNPRKTIDEESIRELADNILQHGLLQPITVRTIEADSKDPVGHFEIVCGERRFRAFKLNLERVPGYTKTIPCIVREMSDAEALDAMITENLQRKDVDPIEEAFAFGQLNKHGKSIDEIAARFGKSKRFITERIKLDSLLPELKKMVTDDKLHIGAAMHICKLTEDEQRKFLDGCADEEEVTKSDAEKFTDYLFMEIERADWESDFEGTCNSTCEKCPFNNANAGCLFYEMKPHDAVCTNRDKWNAKRSSWLLHIVEENADVLVKSGCKLEAGKTVVVVSDVQDYYKERNKEYEPLIQRIKDMGFEVVKKNDYFDVFSSYREDDERLQDKLARNEVYRCLEVGATWRGTEIYVRYYSFKSDGGTQESSEEVQAMRLVAQYRENERKKSSGIAARLRALLSDIQPTDFSKEPLSKTESLVLLALILRNTSCEFRKEIGLDVQTTGEPKVLSYAREHTGDVHKICRGFIRDELASAPAEYNLDLQECQHVLLQEWSKEKSNEVIAEMEEKMAKKQSKIEEKLTALGYNTDGTKIDA